jgi:hypothetical protein
VSGSKTVKIPSNSHIPMEDMQLARGREGDMRECLTFEKVH